MRPLKRPSAVFGCSMLFLLALPLAVMSQDDSSGKSTPPPPPKGQSGSPNVGVGISRAIDLTHMGRAVIAPSHHIPTTVFALLSSYASHLRTPSPDKSRINQEAAALTILINRFRQPRDVITSKTYPSYSEPYQYLYLGVQAIGGSGSTSYVAPEIVYSNTKAGYDVGLDFVSSAGNRESRPTNSIGVSFKYELTDQGRALTGALGQLNKDAASFADKVSGLTDNQLTQLRSAIVNLSLKYQPAAPLTANDTNTLFLDFNGFDFNDSEKPNTPTSPAVNKAAVAAINLANSQTKLLHDYVEKSQQPAVSIFLGDEFAERNSSLARESANVSWLRPFGKGMPGVTLLYAAEGLEIAARSGGSRSGVRNGVAVIFQDRTPAGNDDYIRQLASEIVKDEPKKETSYNTSPLRPTWAFKVGAEYTSPVLGLAKAYTGFVRYRQPTSYWEVTLAYGENGLGKDYGSVSIGQSFPF